MTATAAIVVIRRRNKKKDKAKEKEKEDETSSEEEPEEKEPEEKGKPPKEAKKNLNVKHPTSFSNKKNQKTTQTHKNRWKEKKFKTQKFKGFEIVTPTDKVSFFVTEAKETKTPGYICYRFGNSLDIQLKLFIFQKNSLPYFQVEIPEKGKFLICTPLMLPANSQNKLSSKSTTLKNSKKISKSPKLDVKPNQINTDLNEFNSESELDGFRFIMNKEGHYFLHEIVVPKNFPQNVKLQS